MIEKGFIYRSTVEGFVEEARRLTGTTETLTPSEALAALGEVTAEAEIYMLVSEDGTEEVAAVVTDEEVIFTATENDIREGTVAATSKGVTTGTKVIPSYHTTEAIKAILPGERFSIVLKTHDMYDFTKLQAIFCPFNTTLEDSVCAERVSIEGATYNVNSTEVVALIAKDDSEKSIEFGITNETDVPCLIRYFTYKEIY